MDLFSSDMILLFIQCLDDKDKNNFLSINKFNDNLKPNVLFHTQIYISRIIDLPYYNNFTNIYLDYIFEHQPKLPSSITNLTFAYQFYDNMENYIPSSVTHLNFGHTYNDSIKNVIPLSVTI